MDVGLGREYAWPFIDVHVVPGAVADDRRRPCGPASAGASTLSARWHTSGCPCCRVLGVRQVDRRIAIETSSLLPTKAGTSAACRPALRAVARARCRPSMSTRGMSMPSPNSYAACTPPRPHEPPAWSTRGSNDVVLDRLTRRSQRTRPRRARRVLLERKKGANGLVAARSCKTIVGVGPRGTTSCLAASATIAKTPMCGPTAGSGTALPPLSPII